MVFSVQHKLTREIKAVQQVTYAEFAKTHWEIVRCWLNQLDLKLKTDDLYIGIGIIN